MPRCCTATKCSNLRGILTSTADINDAGRERTSATLSVRRTSRRHQRETARDAVAAAWEAVARDEEVMGSKAATLTAEPPGQGSNPYQ